MQRTSDPRPTANQIELMARIEWSLLAAATEENTARHLVGAHGPVKAMRMVHDEHPDIPTATLQRWQSELLGINAEAVLDESLEQDIRPIIPGDDEWPTRLNDLGWTAPIMLWARGGRHLGEITSGATLAIVGSRASTQYGEVVTSTLAQDAVENDILVISGGAYGIDAAAHRGALAAGGSTIAVLAGGLDNLYPRGNSRLLEHIGSEHLLLSEYPIGAAPTRYRFLARNRLIAALGDATLLVEGVMHSGAMSTVTHARSLDRPVGAVPGPITSTTSEAPNVLIQDGRARAVLHGNELPALVDDRPVA